MALWASAFAGALVLAGCATSQGIETPQEFGADAPASPTANAPLPLPPATVPPGMQFLYGSGEAAALSVQAWSALVSYAATQVRATAANGVVLDENATLTAPVWVPCGAKPKAVVFDVDETVLLNLGFEYDAAAHPAPYDEKRWQAWERTGLNKVAPVPGAVGALAKLRGMGITVIFNTNRSAENAAATEKALTDAGLGPAQHKKTLWLKGDDNTGNLKDVRRWWIADKYCVIAMGGDQLGDFSDLFNAGLTPSARRTAPLAPQIADKWGNGWFVLPNPVYGRALKGGFDEIFPTDKRWAPPAPPEK